MLIPHYRAVDFQRRVLDMGCDAEDPCCHGDRADWPRLEIVDGTELEKGSDRRLVPGLCRFYHVVFEDAREAAGQQRVRDGQRMGGDELGELA